MLLDLSTALRRGPRPRARPLVQRRCVVRGAVADRCRPRARGRGAQRRSRFRRGRRELGERGEALGTALVRLAQRASATAARLVAVTHHAVLVEGANDTRRFEASSRISSLTDLPRRSESSRTVAGQAAPGPGRRAGVTGTPSLAPSIARRRDALRDQRGFARVRLAARRSYARSTARKLSASPP